MSIYKKVKAVERVFDSLTTEVTAFQKTTGLSCVANCGKCCYKPDISATPLEFLPLAYHLYKEKRAVEWLQAMKTYNEPSCPVFRSLFLEGEKGFCSEYRHRGLICRLFGFSAALDKTGDPQLITCKTIKNTQEQSYENAKIYIREGGRVALMRNYYFKLSAIDSNLNMCFYPVREAIIKALETVLAYYAYRRRSA